MSWVAGCDFSTNAVDVVFVDESDSALVQRFTIHLEGADALERTRELSRPLAHNLALDLDDVIAFGIEEPAGQQTGRLFRVQGAILARLPRNLLVNTWMPSEWRASVGLKGNCSKADVQLWAWQRLIDDNVTLTPAWEWHQDACDAYCIALATLQALERKAAA